jgi:hypothetical protein
MDDHSEMVKRLLRGQFHALYNGREISVGGPAWPFGAHGAWRGHYHTSESWMDYGLFTPVSVDDRPVPPEAVKEWREAVQKETEFWKKD